MKFLKFRIPSYKRKQQSLQMKELRGSSASPFYFSPVRSLPSGVWHDLPKQQLLVQPARSASEHFGSVYHEAALPADQQTVLFDVVQETSDLETARLYQTTSVHSTHSESDTLALLPCEQNLARKPSAPSAKSIPEVHDSFTMSRTPPTSARSQSYQSVSSYHPAFKSENTVRTRGSSLRMESLRAISPHPHKFLPNVLHWPNDEFDEYDAERQVSYNFINFIKL
ncbi:unnamed protein product [Echinostoma caproni]|uniref:Uncharacterized protein n=1 Tax=Echinostoma caproni TaxID=27848 RepID=A0A183ADG8_9TREM|nr:unnamed protein product [Echinostoma caproni]